MTRPTLHLVPQARWDGWDPAMPYVPAAYDADGFVHCTDGDEEMLRTANRYYRDDPQPFVVLTVDLDATGSPWQFDDPGSPYPHIYGPVSPSAITEVRGFVRAADGTFTEIQPR